MCDCFDDETEPSNFVSLPTALRVRYKLPSELATATAACDGAAFDGTPDDLPDSPYLDVRCKIQRSGSEDEGFALSRHGAQFNFED